MSRKEPKNIVASVLAQLREKAKSSGAPFQQVLQQYAIERFLYRVSKSKHAQGVVLKGALLLKTIGIPRTRPTMDIDMLRKGKADRASLIALVKDCARLDVEADGLTFLADSVVNSCAGRGNRSLHRELHRPAPSSVERVCKEDRRGRAG